MGWWSTPAPENRTRQGRRRCPARGRARVFGQALTSRMVDQPAEFRLARRIVLRRKKAGEGVLGSGGKPNYRGTVSWGLAAFRRRAFVGNFSASPGGRSLWRRRNRAARRGRPR